MHSSFMLQGSFLPLSLSSTMNLFMTRVKTGLGAYIADLHVNKIHGNILIPKTELIVGILMEICEGQENDERGLWPRSSFRKSWDFFRGEVEYLWSSFDFISAGDPNLDFFFYD